MEYKTIGILGGMGPLATIDLYKKIVFFTDAEKDQDHIPTIISSNTRIPDRTSAIQNLGSTPLHELAYAAVQLECAGADLIVMPCNTAHFYYRELIQYIHVPFLNMIEITANYVKRKNVKKAALLATDGTLESCVYNEFFDPIGVEIIQPGEYQKLVMDLIYTDVKCGRETISKHSVQEMIESLVGKGAELFILGCTELPIAFERYNFNEVFIDPTAELAKNAILCAGGRLRSHT